MGREKVKPVVIHRSMIETFQTDLQFDFVVMMNVLEHCQDALAVFDKIKELLLPGGILVFRELLFHADEVKRLSAILYDAGHPLRVDQSVIDGFLQDFKPLMRAEYYVRREFRGLHLQDHELYYIGLRQGI